MTIPKTKANEATDIFNRLADLDIGDVEEAVRLLFRLRAMDHGYPDLMIKVSLADAALIAGFRDEAVHALETAWGLRSTTDDMSVLGRFQLILLLAGLSMRAVELARQLLLQPGAVVAENAAVNFITTALNVGDLTLLAEIAEREKKTGYSLAEHALEELKTAQIDIVIAEHQRIVRDVVQDHQVGALSWVNEMDEREAILINMFYFDGTQTSRRLLLKQLENALNSHYKAKGLGEGFWRGKIATVLTEAPRHAGAELGAGTGRAA